MTATEGELMTVPAADLLAAGDCAPQCLLALEPDGLCACRCGGKWHGTLSGASVAPSETPARTAPRPKPQGGRTRLGESNRMADEWIRERIRRHQTDPGAPPMPKYPDWGWWPDESWWRTWWRLEAPYLVADGDEDAWEVLNAFYCPELKPTEALGMLFRKDGPLDEDRRATVWPLSWFQADLPRAHLLPGRWDRVFSAHCVVPREAWDHRLSAATQEVQRELLCALLAAGRCTAVNPGHDAVAFGFEDSTEAKAVTHLLARLAWDDAETALACTRVLAASPIPCPTY